MSVIVPFCDVGQHFINKDKPESIVSSVVQVYEAHLRPVSIYSYNNMECDLS